MMQIDKKDKEILFHLSLNARASLKDISNKTRLSKEVIHYRIKNLEKRGVIEGYYAVIDPYKIGMTFYRVYMKTEMDSSTEKRFLDFLKKHPKVTWVVEMNGDLDFLYVVWSKNIIEFEEVYNEINRKFGKYIQKKFFSIMTKVYYLKNKYLLEKQDRSFQLTGERITNSKLDDFDFRLIKLLSLEGRLPSTEIARKLKSNVKTAQRRIKKLVKEKIITCFNIKINHKILGYTQRKVMLNLKDTSKENIEKIISFIINQKDTIYITIAIGQYDIEFEMIEKTHHDFHNLLKEIKNKFPRMIKEYFTLIFYDEPKVGQIGEINKE
ncbi:MAG: Lrp/AsnC family transcriptional regulator [Candidatus Pacearchaeota archaeon]|nr:Lrp/AsnC family transcriptional regulator [Candidatus Pacearchaeota archaeon]